MIHYKFTFKGKDRNRDDFIGTFYEPHNTEAVAELFEDLYYEMTGEECSINIDTDPQGLLPDKLE